MSRARAFIFVFIALIVGGCVSTTPLYESRDTVSIHLYGEPVVTKDSFSISFQFETPDYSPPSPYHEPDVPHFIQWVNVNEWTGVEAFRILPHGKSGVDHHFTQGVRKQHRRITITPGKVEGADETTAGFSMLPSEWADGFNSKYRENHEIKGRVVHRLTEKATVYLLDFEDGKLVWSVEGTDVRREWSFDTASEEALAK